MSNARYGYGWVLKFVLAAILLGVGIYMVFADEVVYAITGVTIIIFSLFRVYPLLKSLNKEILRTLNLFEVVFDTLIGIMMIYIALTYGDTLSSQALWSQVYRFSLVFFFYARGLIFFNSVVFLGEKTEVPKFWIHIAVISLGAIIAVYPDFNYEIVGIFFLIIALIGAGYLGYDGYGGYKKYRQFSKELNDGVQKPKKKDKEAPRPSIEEPEEEKRPYVN
jgi:hypothetical protein